MEGSSSACSGPGALVPLDDELAMVSDVDRELQVACRPRSADIFFFDKRNEAPASSKDAYGFYSDFIKQGTVKSIHHKTPLNT
jgi:hypothetical protein